jgi:hypothetical protein
MFLLTIRSTMNIQPAWDLHFEFIAPERGSCESLNRRTRHSPLDSLPPSFGTEEA